MSKSTKSTKATKASKPKADEPKEAAPAKTSTKRKSTRKPKEPQFTQLLDVRNGWSAVFAREQDGNKKAVREPMVAWGCKDNGDICGISVKRDERGRIVGFVDCSREADFECFIGPGDSMSFEAVQKSLSE